MSKPLNETADSELVAAGLLPAWPTSEEGALSMTSSAASDPRNRSMASTKPRQQHGLGDVCYDFSRKLHTAGLDFGKDHDEVVRTFVASLATKGFVILSGLSGSGKTRIAVSLGEWFGPHRLHVEPVRPDWIDPKNLLGFENLMSESADARYSWNVPRVLEFIMCASRDQHHPYLLLLDEMNLAHVEQYFADVLSGMESGQPIVPNLQMEGGVWRMPVDGAKFLPWPKNLFLVGTINVDETTYKFSPKVIDRANTIEFRVLPGALRAGMETPGRIERGEQELVAAFLRRGLGKDPEWKQTEELAEALEKLHELLYQHNAEFGYRVFREAVRFGALMGDSGVKDFRVVLDQVIVQKILPKFENSRLDFTDAYVALARYACPQLREVQPADLFRESPANALLPRTLDKVQRLFRESRGKA